MQAEEVCWHVQSAFEVAPCACLSFTSTLSTTECILSLQLLHLGTLLEMVLIGAQQRARASDTHSPQATSMTSHGWCRSQFAPHHWHTNHNSQPSDTPAAVPAKLLEGMFISCGVHERLHIRSAVHHMFLTIVRHYRARIPLQVWTATCNEFICMLQDCWGVKMPEQGLPSELSHSSGPQQENKKQIKTPLLSVSVVPSLLIARSLWEELQRPHPVVCPVFQSIHCPVFYSVLLF